MTSFTLISTSLSASSSSRRYVPLVQRNFTAAGAHTVLLDLRTVQPHWMQSNLLSAPPEPLDHWADCVAHADGVVLFVPVYGFASASNAKFVTEVLGSAFAEKPVLFMAAAGTEKSYLAVRDLMASLSFDQKAYCFPRILFDASNAETPVSAAAEVRCRALCSDFIVFSEALAAIKKQRQRAQPVGL